MSHQNDTQDGETVWGKDVSADIGCLLDNIRDLRRALQWRNHTEHAEVARFGRARINKTT